MRQTDLLEMEGGDMWEKKIDDWDRELEKVELLQMLFIISFSILSLFITCLVAHSKRIQELILYSGHILKVFSLKSRHSTRLFQGNVDHAHCATVLC